MEQTTALPQRFEIVEGRVVELSPTGADHGAVEANVVYILKNAVRPGNSGKVYGGEVGVVVSQQPLTVRGADAALVRREQLPPRLSPEGYLLTAPALVVEVLSPNDRASEVQRKVDEYHSAGVLVVLLVDPQNLCITVAQPDSLRLLKGADHLELPSLLPDWTVAVSEFFNDL